MMEMNQYIESWLERASRYRGHVFIYTTYNRTVQTTSSQVGGCTKHDRQAWLSRLGTVLVAPLAAAGRISQQTNGTSSASPDIAVLPSRSGSRGFERWSVLSLAEPVPAGA